MTTRVTIIDCQRNDFATPVWTVELPQGTQWRAVQSEAEDTYAFAPGTKVQADLYMECVTLRAYDAHAHPQGLQQRAVNMADGDGVVARGPLSQGSDRAGNASLKIDTPQGAIFLRDPAPSPRPLPAFVEAEGVLMCSLFPPKAP